MNTQVQTPAAAPQARGNESDQGRVIRTPGPRNGGAPLTDESAGDAIAGLLGDPPVARPRKGKPDTRADAESDLDRAARASLSAADTDADEGEEGHEETDEDEQQPQRDDDAPDEPEAVDDELTDDERLEAEEREAEEREFNARKVKVKVDGKEVEIPVSELRKGYQRHADYSRKTAEIAQERTTLQSHQATVMQQRQALDFILSEQQQVLVQQHGQEPDWDALYQENPLEFTRQRAAWEKRGMDLARLQQIRDANKAVAAQQQAQAMRAHFAEEGRKMLERNPDWADPVKGKALRGQLESYAEKLGFPKGALESVMDARHLEVLDKAMKYDNLLERVKSGKMGKPDRQVQRTDRAATQQPAPKPRPAAPGAAAPPPSRSQRERDQLVQAKKTAARTGKVDDAGAAIARLLG